MFLDIATGPGDKPKWVSVKLDEEYILNVDLVKKVDRTQSRSKDLGKAVTSRYRPLFQLNF